jgi:hypothetical protein
MILNILFIHIYNMLRGGCTGEAHRDRKQILRRFALNEILIYNLHVAIKHLAR